MRNVAIEETGLPGNANTMAPPTTSVAPAGVPAPQASATKGKQDGQAAAPGFSFK